MIDLNKGRVVWFTGLSGSGKSTLAQKLYEILGTMGVTRAILDGDKLRTGLCCDLGFSSQDREENIRRAAEVARLLVDTGFTVIAAFITPAESIRQKVRCLFAPEEYVEVFVDCSLEICEKRDPKGLYKKARSGELAEFTGISAPFERPVNPDIIVCTEVKDPHESASSLIHALETKFPELAPERCRLHLNAACEQRNGMSTGRAHFGVVVGGRRSGSGQA